MNKIRLNNGIDMPAIGFGTYKLMDFEECRNCVSYAVRTGYRLIDTATFYQNTAAVGAGIKKSGVKRSSIFVSTKIWYDQYRTQTCTKAIEQLLEDMELDYLDMVMLHWPFGDVYSAWRVLEKYYKAGKIRALGISNFEPDRMVDLFRNVRIKPSVNQIEMNLFCQRKEERAWMKKYGIAVQAYAPLGHGNGHEMLTNPVIEVMARKYDKTAAQILLKFLLECGVSAVPKSANENRITENFDIFDFELTAEEMTELEELDRNRPLIGIAEDPVKVEAMMDLSGIGVQNK